MSSESAALPRRSLAGDATDWLRSEILSGRWSSGERLTETDIAERLAVSRGPARDALRALVQEGLISQELHRGSRIVEFSATDVDELASLRDALERLAFARACKHATPVDIARLRALIDRMRASAESGDDSRLVLLDVEFHTCVVEAAHHQRLLATWGSIRSQIALFLLRRRGVSDDYAERVVREHSELADAIEAGNVKTAQRLISGHLDTAYRRLRASFESVEDVAGHAAGGRR